MPAATPLSLLICLIFALSTAATSSDLQSLLTLKSSLQSSNSTLFSSWVSGSNSPCNFTGVTCNAAGSVIEINLANQQLTGTLTLDSLCLRLPSLQTLAFGFNSLTGAVPASLNNCTSLRYLDLGNNNFNGEFPPIHSLTNLQYLYLNLSGFTGPFPWSSLSSMTGLLVLSVGDNAFDMTPFPQEVIALKNLSSLYMTNCTISGSIPPGIGDLTELSDLQLADNHLTGEIPPDISRLTNLWQLELYSNFLTGTLPAGFGKLTKLQFFDASGNNLAGNLSELKTLAELRSLQLYYNGFSGEVPPEFGEFKSLVNLSLYNNKLTGELPQTLGSWAEFNFIDVSTNSLSGPIPPDMCKMGTMDKLLLLQNNFSGDIPATYANCSTLTRFRVSQNSLSGVVPAGIWGLPNANIIDIADNEFEGPITADIGNARKLGILYVGNNRLSGNLPSEISSASSLSVVDLSSNQLSGEIPGNIGNLTQIGTLYLNGNKLSGSIPDSISSCIRLSDLNLACNSFSGRIPVSLGSLPVLNSLNLSHNQLSGQIPNTFSSLRLSLLDLSNNKLSGPVPASLSVEAYNGSFNGNSGLCGPNMKGFPSCPARSREIRTFILCSLLGVTLLILLLGGYGCLKRKEGRNGTDSFKSDYSWDMKSYHVLTFTEDEILDSIKQENLIGKGGSGSVYKVRIKDGNELAVKHIWNSGDDRKRTRSSTPFLSRDRSKCREFDSEVQVLSSIRHVNVVKLYCSITSEDSSLLVYEYMPNGSLWDRLHSCKKLGLDWQSRYEIALGAARGLEYLHHGYERSVIHRDVKSSNILLDEFLKPRIADFGLAKIVQVNEGRDSSRVIPGTHGYIAPEYGYTTKVNEKSDVYSFGVVLMELVSGRRPLEPEFGEGKDIVSWVSSKLKDRESALSIVDPTIPEHLEEEAIKVLKIAILCTTRLPDLRPTMRTVVQMLEDAEPCKLVGIVVGKDGFEKKADGHLAM